MTPLKHRDIIGILKLFALELVPENQTAHWHKKIEINFENTQEC